MGCSIRWTTKVPKSPDISLRSNFAWQGMKKIDVMKSVEGTVRALVLITTVDEVRARNSHVPDEEIKVGLNEALRW
jgi:hypothetical protein